jgi:uncharacterized protein with GYD domain
MEDNMQTFIMMTRLNAEGMGTTKGVVELERRVMTRVRSECPGVEWVASYATFGPYDYLDVFRAEGIDTAAKVAAITRAFGHAHAEIWPAVDWRHYKDLVREIPAAA